MGDTRYMVGKRLNETTALQMASDLAQLNPALETNIVIDFTQTQHFEPFAMLFVASAVRRLTLLAEKMGSEVWCWNRRKWVPLSRNYLKVSLVPDRREKANCCPHPPYVA